MIALMKKNLRLWGYGKAVALFVGCLLFSLSERVNGVNYYQQHILSAVSDHYYLTYFMLPMVLFSAFSFLDDDGEPMILRFESYHRYFWRKWFGVGLIALLLVAIQTAAILLSGIGLPSGNHWQLAAGATEMELFTILQQSFTDPAQTFIAFTLYQFAGSWMIFGIGMWIRHFASRKWSVRLIVALYLFSAVWMKVSAVQSLPITGLNHLLILHHNLGAPHRFAVTGITAALIAALMALTVRFAWRGQLPHLQVRGGGIAVYYRRQLVTRRNLLILCGVTTGITLYKGLAGGFLQSGTEWVYTLFAGHGTGYFQVLPFLELLITIGAPLYLLAVFAEHTVNGQSIFIIVRTRSRKNVMRGILSVSIMFLALYALLWLAAGVLGMIFVGGDMELSACKMLLYAVLMKFLDMLLQFLVILAVYLFTKQITIGFLILVAGNLLCMLQGAFASYLPFGLSSLTRISLLESAGGISAVTALCIEGFLTALFFIGMFALGGKKILN